MKHPTDLQCRFHPKHEVRWYCNACKLPLCSSCKPYADQLPHDVHCPLCDKIMQGRLEQGEQSSFAVALSNALALPSLLLATAAAAAAALSPGGLAGLLLSLPAAAVVFYGMLTLARRAGEGRIERPGLTDIFHFDAIEYGSRLLPAGLPCALLLSVAVLTQSTPLAVLAWLGLAAVLPAAVLTAVVTGSPAAALQPARLWQLVERVALPCALLALTGAAAAFILVPLAGLFDGNAGRAFAGVVAFVAALLALALGSQTGLLASTHRRVLDYAAGVAPIDRPRRPEPDVHEPALMVADARILLREKRTRDARQALGAALTRYPDEPELNAMFDQLVAETAGPNEFLNHLERRMRRLVRTRQAAAATDLWQRHNHRLKKWMPRASETRYHLALELDERGEHQTAFRLLISLPPDDQKFSHIVDAWMQAARILEDRLEQSGRAQELRRIVQQRFPEGYRQWRQRWQPLNQSAAGNRQPAPASAALNY